MGTQPTRVDREAVRADWATQGFSCELWVDPPTQVWHDVQHEVDVLLLLLEGNSLLEFDNRILRLLPGDEICIRAGTRFTVRNQDEAPTRWLHGYRWNG